MFADYAVSVCWVQHKHQVWFSISIRFSHEYIFSALSGQNSAATQLLYLLDSDTDAEPDPLRDNITQPTTKTITISIIALPGILHSRFCKNEWEINVDTLPGHISHAK